MNADERNNNLFNTSFEESDLEQAAEYAGRQALKKRLQNAESKLGHPQPKLGFSMKRIWAIAAGILLLIGGFWLYNSNMSNYDQIASSYYVAPNFSGTRGENEQDDLYRKAVNSFYQKKYGEVASMLKTGKEAKDKYLLAHAYFISGAFSEARSIFLELSKSGSGEMSYSSEWFAALAALKMGDEEVGKSELKPISVSQSNPYQTKAIELLQDL